MQAIIFADRHGHELAPLCEERCPALLSVANRPLLQYTLEDVALAGIRDVLMIISDDAERIQASFGDGALWGLNIRYLLSRGEESPTQLLSRYQNLLRLPCLVARGDVLRTSSCASFISLAASVPSSCVQAGVEGLPIGLALLRDWPGELPALAWPLAASPAGSIPCLEVPEALFAPLASLADFHRTALRLTPQPAVHTGPPGVDREAGLRVGALSQAASCNRVTGPVAIGSNTWLHPSARLTGPCLVGDNCYLDRGARLHDSVVMPGSYIGENLSIGNAIVSGDTLIRVDREVVVKISEPKLLTSTSVALGSLVRQWPERVMAALMLLLSLPLWPLALLLSLLTSPRAPVYRRSLLSNRQRFRNAKETSRKISAWLFATRIPILRHLPLLWLVIRGDLRLFGARPRNTIDEERHHPTNGGRPTPVQAGLFGPQALYLPEQAPEEEIRLNELAFTADQRATIVFIRLLQASRLLFRWRAWRSPVKSLQEC